MQQKKNDPYTVSAEDMQGWLKREIADIAKAMELRVKEATALVDAYARGESSERELDNRIDTYSVRWGEALPGVGRSDGKTDQQILRRIDKTRSWQDRLERDPARTTPDTSKRRRR